MTKSARQALAALGKTALITALAGCAKETAPPSGSPPAKSASAAPVVTATAPTPAGAAAPTASAPAAPAHTCEAGTTGEGTLSKPCEAGGNKRAMEVTWTGKTTDSGPSFRVVNRTPATILWGKILVYFYDKGGKQLEVKDATGKTRPYQVCSGNLFSGVMKADEKAVITFSCVKKEHVPEGTAHIEAEMQMVGFADATEKRSEWFWKNADLTPEARPKGGVKK